MMWIAIALIHLLLVLPHAEAQQNLTSLVNLFIGTASGNGKSGGGGNAFPGAAIPHGMAKVSIDVTSSPRQAGYVHDNSSVTGISLLHDEGTGGNAAGGYGVFPLFPIGSCEDGEFERCTVDITQRATLRAAGGDGASPGYFTTTFTSGIKIETTSTRRAGLTRFTYPESSNIRSVVVDLTNDLQRSFHGGSLSIVNGSRVMLSGTFLQSYGPDNYTAFACYDFSHEGQPITQFGTYQSNSTSSPTNITITTNSTELDYPFSSSTNPIQAGAIFAFSNDTNEVLGRFGVSMISSAQACSNAESEVPDWDFDAVQSASRDKWEDVLGRIQVDVGKENADVVEMLYSSLYRVSLVPANFTNENPYWANDEPFYDALFCSWDTHRTVHPLHSLVNPLEWAEIVRAYVDGWRNTGYIPECRSNTKAGYVQGGSDGMPILGDFAVKYASRAGELDVNVEDLYQALVDTAENTPPDWYRVGRQNTAWKTFGYIPTDWDDPSGSTGLPTREASRALEYALGDFAVRQTALTLNKSSADVAKYENRSMNFINHWNASLEFDGFEGFMQRRYPNGSFAFSPPDACAPIDPVAHACARDPGNDVGFYESSSWEYSFFAPHSMATIIRLMGGASTFVNRLDSYFSKGYFYAGNEPGFETPWLYHYAGRPDLSAKRVREVVFENFNTGVDGIPGNDDSGAMSSLLIFHMLGLYPVLSTTQYLIGSPMLSSYTLNNNALGTSTTFTVSGFDSSSLSSSPPDGSRLFVKSVSVNGVAKESVCWLDFADVVGGGKIVIEVDGDASAAEERGCGVGDGAIPGSLEGGGL